MIDIKNLTKTYNIGKMSIEILKGIDQEVEKVHF